MKGFCKRSEGDSIRDLQRFHKGSARVLQYKGCSTGSCQGSRRLLGRGYWGVQGTMLCSLWIMNAGFAPQEVQGLLKGVRLMLWSL